MKLPASLTPAIEWLLRSRELGAARAERDGIGAERTLALDQARLLLEVARRVAEPAETLPRGSRPAVLLDLYRSAVTWALRASHDGTERPLAELWEAAPPERLRAAAGDDAGVQKVRELLLSQPANGSLKLLDTDVRPLRDFAEALERELDVPNQRVARVQRQRWTRLGLLAAIIAAIAIGMPYLTRGGDLAKGRPFKLSSVYNGCNERGKCGELMFHTENEKNPWVSIDLGGKKTVRAVEVTNRSDCCGERAVPLSVELSEDGRRFSEVARREDPFGTWTAKFKPKQARYVRLRSQQTTFLHLENVVVR